MKLHSFIKGLGILAFCLGIQGCGQDNHAPRGEKGVRSESREPLVPVVVEVRADGLAYLPGAAEPFTGEAIAPFEDSPWRAKLVEPYKNGKRDGDKRELYKDGSTKSLRRYDNGLPKYAATFHKNGKKKYEVHLNAQDRGEGPYSRWYENGVLEATAGLDALERWHGEFKEWTREGELKSHYFFKEGVFQRIVFESPEAKAVRLDKGITLPEESAPPAVAAPPAEKLD